MSFVLATSDAKPVAGRSGNRRLSRAEEAIDVGAGHHRAGEELGHVRFFVRGVGRDQRRELVTLVVRQRFGDDLDGVVPGRLVRELPTVRLRAPDGWVKQSILVLNLLVTPLAALTEVAVVRAALPEIGHATHETAVGLDVEGAADVAEPADRLRGVELPWVESEMAVGQRSDRADRDAHAARGAERLREVGAVGGGDGRLERSVGALDRGHADHFVADARAPVAHDAPVPLVVDELAEVGIRLGELGTAVGVGVDVVQIGVVLEIALAGLVAGRAVQRVVDQVHLQDELPRLHDVRGVRQHFHAVGERGRAGLDQTAALAQNLDGADAARSPGAQQRLETEIGNLDAGHAGSLKDDRPRGDGHFLPVDGAGDHLLFGASRSHHRCDVRSPVGSFVRFRARQFAGASVLQHEQFYHAGLVKPGRFSRVGSREEW